jgi:polyhydroxybutyrate depolymerase
MSTALRAAMLLVLGLFFAGCASGDDDDSRLSDDDSTGGGAGDDAADDDAADDDSGEAWQSAGCEQGAGTAGSYQGAMSSDGYDRTYLLDVPTSYDGSPVPLVVNLHGTGATAAEQKLLSRLSLKGDDEGFITVYPESLEYDIGEKIKSWIIGNCDNRDTGFIADLLDRLEADYCLDLRRVYVTGISNGAYFSHILATIYGDRVAAIGPVAGGLGPVGKLCDPTRPMPAVIVHGAQDDVIPVEEGREARDFWIAFNQCSTEVPQDNGCQLHTDCADGADVLYCEQSDGVHWWPHGDFEATDVIWAFFADHAR